jgi:hypothetical protein
MGVGAMALVLSLSAAACAGGGASAPKSTGSSPSGAAQALDGYMDALQGGDSGRLLAMSNPRHDARPVITAKIDQMGERRWTKIAVVWPEVVAAGVPVADITATGPSGESISDHVVLGRDGDRWEIDLGDTGPG